MQATGRDKETDNSGEPLFNICIRNFLLSAVLVYFKAGYNNLNVQNHSKATSRSFGVASLALRSLHSLHSLLNLLSLLCLLYLIITQKPVAEPPGR